MWAENLAGRRHRNSTTTSQSVQSLRCRPKKKKTPGKENRFSSFIRSAEPLRSQTNLLFNGYGGIFLSSRPAPPHHASVRGVKLIVRLHSALVLGMRVTINPRPHTPSQHASYFNFVSLQIPWNEIAQLVQQLATNWTIRGSNPVKGRDFPHPSRPALGPNEYHVIAGGKAAGAWRYPATPSSAEVKKRVELYFYSPSGPSWPVVGWTLPLPACKFKLLTI